MRWLAVLLCLFLSPAWADGSSPIIPAPTATISCTSSSTATAITIGANAQDGRLAQIEVQNAGNVTIFVQPGISTVTAAVGVAGTTTAGYPVLAGQSKVISVGNAVTHLACISASTTTTVYATVGWGN